MAKRVKETNSELFKELIIRSNIALHNQEVIPARLDDIIDCYNELRDELKSLMFDTKNKEELDKKYIDVHKISACLTIAIYRHLGYNDNRYYNLLIGYNISLILIHTMNNENDLELYGAEPESLEKSKYVEELNALLLNNTNQYSNNISCITNLSHIYFHIENVWKVETNFKNLLELQKENYSKRMASLRKIYKQKVRK